MASLNSLIEDEIYRVSF